MINDLVKGLNSDDKFLDCYLGDITVEEFRQDVSKYVNSELNILRSKMLEQINIMGASFKVDDCIRFSKSIIEARRLCKGEKIS